ncbi:MAG: lysylphosphatidylglycerol synthase transmembrane domain-containing protein [Pseudolabrys sp.]
MRRPLLLLIKAAVSILLLYLSLRSADLAAVGERLSRLEAGWIALALVLLAAQVAVLAVRWRAIAAVCGAALGLGAALRFSFIAMFFNQVLPSTVGGDAARVYLLARHGAGWASATYSVLIDRAAGMVALAVIVAACLPWTLALIGDPLARAVLVLIGAGVIGGALAFLAIGFAPRAWFDRFMPARHLAETSRMAWRLCRDGGAAPLVAACSLAIHLLTVTAAWCCIKAVAAPVGFAPILFLMPPVLLVATVPISIAGWGVRESSMVVAFAYAGLAPSDGLSLSILFGAATFVVGIAGGAVWIASGLKVGEPEKPG